MDGADIQSKDAWWALDPSPALGPVRRGSSKNTTQSDPTLSSEGLLWVPDDPAAASTSTDPSSFSLADVSAKDFRQGRYEVMHYGPSAYGLAFGPLSLGQVLRFCQDLAHRCQQHESVTFRYAATPKEQANCALLLGAFLVLCRGWTAARVGSQLPKEARLPFVCSWLRAEKVKGIPIMKVEDCWEGLEVARRHGWIQVGAKKGSQMLGMTDGHLMTLAVSQYQRTCMQFDGCWLVPSEVLVMADPMTTIKDPNPATCPSLLPVPGQEEEDEPLSPASSGDKFQEKLTKPLGRVGEEEQELDFTQDQGSKESRSHEIASPPGDSPRGGSPRRCEGSKATTAGGSVNRMTSRLGTKNSLASLREPEECTSELGRDMVPQISAVNDEEDKNTSLHSVCKNYMESTELDDDGRAYPKGLDFVSFLHKHGVRGVVRTNEGSEEGLKEIGGSYDPSVLERNGIHHMDYFVKDVNGGIPGPDIIQAFFVDLETLASTSSSASAPPDKAEHVPAAEPSAPDDPDYAGLSPPTTHDKAEEVPRRKGSKGSADSGPPAKPPLAASAAAVAIHCKSGFGRSMLLACILIIHRYDVPGRALLGWARIVRPGAFTVPEQEEFLCSLRGREDLHRHFSHDNGSVKCCAVQ